MAKFFTRSKKAKGIAKLYTRVYLPKGELLVCSGITVNVEAWNKAQKNASALAKYFSTSQGAKVQEQMNVISGLIADLCANGKVTCADDKDVIVEAIEGVIYAEARKAQEEVRERKRAEEEKRLHRIHDYFDYFVNGIANGTILQERKGKAYRVGTVRVWQNFGKFLKDYTPKEMTFDEINKRFADGFTVYLQNLGLMAKTINKNVLCFRSLCNSAAMDEKNNNLVSVKVWKERTVKDNEKRAEIALSDAEINALYNMPLTGYKEQVRDLWVLGFFSGQRVSDYGHFTRDNFKVTKSGVPVIVLQQVKTGNDVVVPILDERVKELCAKYDYDFPNIAPRQMNLYIKTILRELSETVPSLAEWVRTPLSVRELRKEQHYYALRESVEGGKVLHGEEKKTFDSMAAYAEAHGSGDTLYKRDYAGEVIKQRWELVSCHTSRRSAVTSLYDSGLYDVRDMMSISGHTTIANFEKYIRRGSVEQAERIAAKAAKAKEVTLRRKEA